MNRFNPLFQNANSKKNVEVVRPQIIQNTINQTNDNIVIEKLQNQKLLIGQDDKIVSSGYSITDIFNDFKKTLPSPLVAGSNIDIVNGVVHSKMYDDTDVKNIIKNNMEEFNANLTDLSQNYNEFKNSFDFKCDNLSKQQITLMEDVNNINKRQNVLNALLNDSNKEFSNELKANYKEIETLKKNNNISNKVINNKIVDLENDYKKSIDDLKKSINLDDKNKEKKYDVINDKLDKYNVDMNNKIEYNKELLEENANKLYVDIQNNSSNAEERILNNFKKMLEDVCNKYDAKLQKKEQEITKLSKMVETLNNDVVNVKDLDPNSKQLQKIIKKLTDKVTLIDKHFKFNNVAAAEN